MDSNSQQSNQQAVRPAAFAGKFYPQDEQRLQAQLHSYFNQVEKRDLPLEPGQAIQILFAPHAGYPYSGQVAAYSYAQFANEEFLPWSARAQLAQDNQEGSAPKNASRPRIILLGASHQAGLQQAALYQGQGWQTPLGLVKIDQTAVESLAQSSAAKVDNSVHQQEHSLEVQLPFLQQQVTDFTIVPILVGDLSRSKLKQLTQDLLAALNKQSLLVVSTDLSHYPPYKLAQQADRETIQAILSGEPEHFLQVAAEIKPTQALQTRVCGKQAVEVALRLGQQRQLSYQLLKYANSGDVSGQRDRVVGYAALVGYTGSTTAFQPANSSSSLNSNSSLNSSQALDSSSDASNLGQHLVKLARQAVEAAVADQRIPPFNLDQEAMTAAVKQRLQQKLGAFVTLHKHNRLRGCIGRLESDQPLGQTIQTMAKAAALDDPRFPPVSKQELSELEIEVSVLSRPQPVSNAKEIEVGKHGVIMEHGQRRGVFLPQVATEHDYNREQFLTALCTHKMGLKPNCWQDPKTELKVFTAEVYQESDFEQ